MSGKGSARRPTAIPDREALARWEATFKAPPRLPTAPKPRKGRPVAPTRDRPA